MNAKWPVYFASGERTLGLAPVSDFVTRILNVNGEILLKNENEQKLDLSGMKQGLYILEITTKNGVYRQKLIKK